MNTLIEDINMDRVPNLRRDWARRDGAAGATHYISRTVDQRRPLREMQTPIIHLLDTCSGMIDPIPLNGRLVDAIWTEDCDAREQGHKPLIWWCENCSVHPRSDWPGRVK